MYPTRECAQAICDMLNARRSNSHLTHRPEPYALGWIVCAHVNWSRI